MHSLDLPLVLCGPILRRVDDGRVAVWIALRESRALRLTVMRPDGSVVADTRETSTAHWTSLRQFGTNLWVGVVEVLGVIVPTDDDDDALWSYTLQARAPGSGVAETLQATWHKDSDQQPTEHRFLPVPEALTTLRIAHGSCRALKDKRVGAPKPEMSQPFDAQKAGEASPAAPVGNDTMAGLATLLYGPRHPHQLFLTGDQIYADSIPKAFLPFFTWLGRDVLGVHAALPALDESVDGASAQAIWGRYPPLFRQSAIRWEAGFTASATNHLLDFSEFVACYLLSWSPALWHACAGYFAREIAPKVAERAREAPPLALLAELASPRPISAHSGPLPERAGVGVVVGSDLATLRDQRYAVQGEPSTLSAEDLAKRWVQDQIDWARQEQWARLEAASAATVARLPEVARVLASVPTYMICDDHEISDDWYATRGWRERVFARPLGTAIVRNGLMAYTVFQAWGNDPERWSRGDEAALLDAIASVGVGGLTDPRQARIHTLLGLPSVEPKPSFRPKVRFDYLLHGARWPHRVYVLDGRTRRNYSNRDGTAGSLDFLGTSAANPTAHFAASAMAEQLPDPPKDGKLAVVVAAIPVVVPDTLPMGLLPLQGLIPLQSLRDVDAEAWSFNQTTYEALLRRLAQLGDVVLLSGDIHLSYGAVLDYWAGDAPPKRVVQFVASGFSETWGGKGALLASNPALIEVIAGLNPVKSFPAQRLGWGDPHGGRDLPAGALVQFDATDAAKHAAVPPDLRSRLVPLPLRSADGGGEAGDKRAIVVVPTRGWPEGTTATTPDWAWRSWLLRDDAPGKFNPAGEATFAHWDPAAALDTAAEQHDVGKYRSVFGRTLSLGASFGLVRFEGGGGQTVAVQDLYGALPAREKHLIPPLELDGDHTRVFLHTSLRAPLCTPTGELRPALTQADAAATDSASGRMQRAAVQLFNQLALQSLEKSTRAALTDILHDLNLPAKGSSEALKASLRGALLDATLIRQIGAPELLEDLAALEAEQNRLNAVLTATKTDATGPQALAMALYALSGPLAQRAWPALVSTILGALAATQLPAIHQIGLTRRVLRWPWAAFREDFAWAIETESGVEKALSPALIAVALPPWILARLLLLPGQLGGLLAPGREKEASQAASILWAIGGVLPLLVGDESFAAWSGWEPDKPDELGEGDHLPDPAGIVRRTLRFSWRRAEDGVTTPLGFSVSLEQIEGVPALRFRLYGGLEKQTALGFGLGLDVQLEGTGSFWLRLPSPGDLDFGWGGMDPVDALMVSLTLKRPITLRYSGIEATFQPELALRLGARAGKDPKPVAELMFRLAGKGLFIQPDPDADGVLALLFHGDGVRIPVPLEVGYRVGEGWVFGGVGYALAGLGALSLASMAAPAPETFAEEAPKASLASFARLDNADRSSALRLGALRLSGVRLRWGREGDDARLSLTSEVALTLGPLALGVGVGLSLHAGVHPDSEDVFTHGGGLSWRDLWFTLDTRVVSGSGALLFRDKDHWGAGLQLRVLDRVDVLALVSVERVNGTLSFVAMLCATGLRIPIGFGFQLDGVGGVVGLNRAPDPDAIAALLKTEASAALFPSQAALSASDGLSRALASLAGLFPYRKDHLTLGPTLLVRWRGLLNLTLAVVLDYDLAADSVHRLLLFGQGRLLVLPELGRWGVDLRVSLLTQLDLSAGELSLDGQLDGTMFGMAVQGDLRGWVGWKAERGFVFSAGGFHPDWIAAGLVPRRFEGMRRIAGHWSAEVPLLTMTVTIDGYLAITSNTVQLGASWEVKAKALGGLVSFGAKLSADVLVQFSPFLADIWLKGSGHIQLVISWSVRAELRLRLGEHFRSVYVHLHKSMPWWCPDICWSKTYTLWGAEQAIGERVGASGERVLALLDKALLDPGSWTATPLYPTAALVLGPSVDGIQRILPDSALIFRQSVAPLNTPLTRLDGQDGAYTLAVTAVDGAGLDLAPFDEDAFDMTPFRAVGDKSSAKRALTENRFARASCGVRLRPKAVLGLRAPAEGGESSFYATVRMGLRPDKDGAACVTLSAGESKVTQSFDLAAPAHVSALDPGQVLRTWPPADTQDADPAFWPFIELKRADLPWLLSRDQAPWLTLLVLPEAGLELLEREGGARMSLRISAALLPSTAEITRRAHAEYGGGSPEADLLLRPEAWRARLLWSGGLEAHTRHVAALVPVLWSDADATVTLPIFHLWRFRTGANVGLEASAKKLRLTPAPTEVPSLVFRAGPGQSPHNTPARFLAMAPDTDLAPANGAAAAALEGALKLSSTAAPPTTLRPPVYGAAFAPKDVGPAQVSWLNALNRDPGYRLAASVGAAMVRAHQDELVEQVWGRIPADLLAKNAAAQSAWLAAKSALHAAPALDAPAADAPLRRTVLREIGAADPKLRDALGLRLDTGVALSRKIRASGNTQKGDSTTEPETLSGGPTDWLQSLLSEVNEGMAALANVAVAMNEANANDLGSSLEAPAAQRLKAHADLLTLSRVILLPPTTLTEGPRPGQLLAKVGLLNPVLRWLVAGWPELLSPALRTLPEDSVTIFVHDPAFVAALLIGLNHELGRELAWRQVPVDPSHPILPTFWRDPNTEGLAFRKGLARADTALAALVPTDFVLLALRSPLVANVGGLQVLSLCQENGADVAYPAVFTEILDAQTMLIGLKLDPSMPRLRLEETTLHGTRFGGEDDGQDGATFAASRAIRRLQITVPLTPRGAP